MEKSKLIETKENLTKQYEQLKKEVEKNHSSLLMVQGALELNDFYIKELEKSEEAKIAENDTTETIKE